MVKFFENAFERPIETPVKIVPTGESRVDPITNRTVGPDGKLQ